jgi:integrase
MRTENRIDLSDAWLRNAEPAPEGKRYVRYDVRVPDLGVRVTDKGVVSFFIMKRIAGNPTPERLTLGRYPLLSLAEARKTAKEKLEVIEKGKDPREEEARQRAAEAAEKAKREAATFRSWAERFKADHLRRLRSGDQLWKHLERDLMPAWGDTLITDIRRSDIKARLNSIETQSGPYARNRRLALIRKLFNFVLDEDEPPIDANPAARIRELAEERRQRALTDDELAEVWRAAETLSPTYSAIIRLLILIGQRRGEVAGMAWAELDSEGLWTIPARRMKGKLAHEVPLPQAALDIIKDVHRIEGSSVVFPGRTGKQPIRSFVHVKAALDSAIAEARKQAGIVEPMKEWRIHDLRRTMRSGLSKLKIPHEVAERVIAHIPGSDVAKAYNVWDYREEKREALQAWANYVQRIINPQNNVVSLRA